MNSVVLIGRLTRDPELRYTPDQSAVATFTLAVDRPFSKEKAGDPAVQKILEEHDVGSEAEYIHHFGGCRSHGRCLDMEFYAFIP